MNSAVMRRSKAGSCNCRRIGSFASNTLAGTVPHSSHIETRCGPGISANITKLTTQTTTSNTVAHCGRTRRRVSTWTNTREYSAGRAGRLHHRGNGWAGGGCARDIAGERSRLKSLLDGPRNLLVGVGFHFQVWAVEVRRRRGIGLDRQVASKTSFAEFGRIDPVS